ncbi:hypothetical protein F9278_24795 [Streptomyces phaeolivaceus]|uniref:Uncharacterized protein n=1 Tax=Streptomyces phaeolivaceus TaxID=2653200 RepID=A0A5P8K731_9ACTN|nr:hypothetical protein [Streptomyces phaeolivaceus]QFQ98850.1 hypothetical protein F9278_24795 [Streptomyces phaeolivaceus]
MNHPTSGTGPTGTGTGTDSETESETETGAGVAGEHGADTGQLLREAFAEAAYGFTPPPVPLEAIERDGRRRRRRRRTAAVGAGCGLLLIPLVVALTLRPDDPSSTVQPMAPPQASADRSPSPTPTPTSTPTPTRSSESTGGSGSTGATGVFTPGAGQVRIVAVDERVTTEQGTELWLTEDGKHWRDPDPDTGAFGPDEFRSLVDGNLDTTEPGLTMQGSGSATSGYTVHGLFYGVRTAAAGVRITAYDGTVVDGTVLRLRGDTGWGVYYGHVKVPEELARSLDFQDPVHEVAVYDANGKVIAEMDFGP